MGKVRYEITRYQVRSHEEHDSESWTVLDFLVKRREDSAQLCLQNAIYRAADQQGLRDVRSAHEAMKWANAWTRKHPIPIQRIGSQAVKITVLHDEG